MAHTPMTAIVKGEDVVTSNVAAVPVNRQLGTSLPLSVVVILLTFPHPVLCSITVTQDELTWIRFCSALKHVT